MPSKADPEKQRSFVETTLEPLLGLAEKGAVQLWSKARIFVKTASGRSRYNVLGALNFASKKMTTITNETYITSTQIVMLIDKLLIEYPNEIIKLVMDNAKYQRCKLVMEYAAKYDVELIFLPTYSPNLNLIERVWKFVKAEVLNAAYIGSFVDFKNAIDDCISNLDKKHSAKMNSLITGKFQLYDIPKIEPNNEHIVFKPAA